MIKISFNINWYLKIKMTKKLLFIFFLLLNLYLVANSNQNLSNLFQTRKGQQKNITVGYRIGKVTGYTKLKQFNKSTLYRVQATELDDGRPMKLLDLHGTHYEVGYAYGNLLAHEIQFTYKTIFGSINNQIMIKILQSFLDWQYKSFVKKQIPVQFLQEIKGIRQGGKQQKVFNLHKYVTRTLTLSNFPEKIEDDIIPVLMDEFLRDFLVIKNDKMLNFIQQNLIFVIKKIENFIREKSIKCSFFGTWGARTQNEELYTMRNLDWASNMGVNVNKLIMVYHIDDTIPHATLGYPGIIGALTGISQAGLTASQAGQSSELQSMTGFQWTLRMKYVLMKANNLKQAIQIWETTKNTLGQNFMIGSAKDNKAVAIQTMRGYSAYFYDFDKRQNRTLFQDFNGNLFVAGYSMPNAIFRTNHAYDPLIRKHSRNRIINQTDGSILRYKAMKDSFVFYQKQDIKISYFEALNITAIAGDKGTSKFINCQNNSKGSNVISVLYQPKYLKMWVAFEYGFNQTFRSACCAVYVEMDMQKWLSK